MPKTSGSWWRACAPPHLRANFRVPAKGWREKMEAAIHAYYAGTAGMDMTTAKGRDNLRNELHFRLDASREKELPWLDHVQPLKGARILEIGCGTGSSTVAMAEQGAQVVGVDVDAPSLDVAKLRCELYGVEAEFHACNAAEAAQRMAGREFDLIIFFASLEHMTHDERLAAMRSTWEMLRPGQIWCVMETPNRLWFYDHHSALMPFYLWLPDDLALKYAQFSDREDFRNACKLPVADPMTNFLRQGRGVSFHEFDLTMGPVDELDVIGCRSMFIRKHRLGARLGWYLSHKGRFERFLAKRAKRNIHRAFFHPSLDITIRKR
ncbi:MAG: class I SAM-dependent methyltransferase [Phycisphaeraceae bacterium]